MLGDKIKQLRMSQGLSQTDFAKRLYVTPAAVNQWEKGKNKPDIDRLLKIAEVFAVPLDYFSEDGKQYSETELIKQHVLIELGADKPRTDEARILAKGVDRMPKDQREQALKIVRAVFDKYADYFNDEGETKDDNT